MTYARHGARRRVPSEALIAISAAGRDVGLRRGLLLTRSARRILATGIANFRRPSLRWAQFGSRRAAAAAVRVVERHLVW